MRITKIGISVFVLVVVAAIFSIVAWNLPTKVSAQSERILFSFKTTPEAKSGDERNSPASIKETDISIDLEKLTADLNRLSFPLFDDKTHHAVRLSSEGIETRGVNSLTWRGSITERDFRGDVVLTVHKGYVSGLIYSPGGVYEIVTKGDRQILIQLDQSLFPECGGAMKPETSKEAVAPPRLGAVEDSGDRIDVLVVYTEAVKNAVGGDAQAQALAQAAIDISNTAYLNSRIRQRLRLVHTEETALTEANSLSQLRSDAATQTLRNTHNADMVAMLVDSLSGCGVGYLMTNVSTGFASSAYSITLRTCAVGNLTFAHELGHNMGSTHDPANGGSAAYSYSYGHYVDGSYRSVMSYSNQCTSGCTRVPQFSNPAIFFNNAATGILGQRNNARSIQNTADTVSNFRYSGSSLRLDNYSENGFIPRNLSKSVNWSSNNAPGNVNIELSRDEGSSWETIVANTPNDGTEVISIFGRPTRRARIRISSVGDPATRDSSVRNISVK